MPKRTVDEIKSNWLRPALTSHFEVKIPIPPGLTNEYLSANGLGGFKGLNQEKLYLLCSETSLPGSNIGTMDITGTAELPQGVEMVMPGDNVKMTIKLIYPVALEKGQRFAIREGGRTVGSGVISNIIE